MLLGTREEEGTKKIIVRIVREREFHKRTEKNRKWNCIEITVDVVWQARAKMCDNKVNGAEDAIVSEMIKRKSLQLRCVFNHTSWVTWRRQACGKLKLVFCWKLDAEPKNGIRSYRAVAFIPVISKWFASCIILRLEQEREPENCKKKKIG